MLPKSGTVKQIKAGLVGIVLYCMAQLEYDEYER